jgi:hypothetical protein
MRKCTGPGVWAQKKGPKAPFTQRAPDGDRSVWHESLRQHFAHLVAGDFEVVGDGGLRVA